MFYLNNQPTGNRVINERVNPDIHGEATIIVEKNAEYHRMRIQSEMARLKAIGKDPVSLNAGVADRVLKDNWIEDE